MKSQFRGLVLVVTVLTLMCSPRSHLRTKRPRHYFLADDYQSAVRDFTRVLDVVQNNYAEPVDVDKAVYQGAIPGMLRMLDPHSNFFDAKQFALLREDQRGKYYGVGMVVAPRENHTVVMAPYVGAPAYNAGLRPGDVICQSRRKAHRRPHHQRSRRPAQRPQGHHRKNHRRPRRLRRASGLHRHPRRNSAPLRRHRLHA